MLLSIYYYSTNRLSLWTLWRESLIYKYYYRPLYIWRSRRAWNSESYILRLQLICRIFYRSTITFIRSHFSFTWYWIFYEQVSNWIESHNYLLLSYSIVSTIYSLARAVLPTHHQRRLVHKMNQSTCGMATKVKNRFNVETAHWVTLASLPDIALILVSKGKFFCWVAA